MRWVIVLWLVVSPVAGNAGTFSVTTTPQQDALLTIRAGQLGAAQQQLIERACQQGWQALNQRFVLDNLDRVREKYGRLPEARRQAVDAIINEVPD